MLLKSNININFLLPYSHRDSFGILSSHISLKAVEKEPCLVMYLSALRPIPTPSLLFHILGGIALESPLLASYKGSAKDASE